MGHVKVIQSGRIVEIFEYEKEIPPKNFIRKKPRKRDIKLHYLRPDNTSRRLKSFRRLVTSNIDGETKPALLTLTMYEIVSLRRGYAAFHKFIRKLREDKGKSFRYIAVPEFQKRGAVHFHCLMWGLEERLSCSGYYVGKGKYKKFVHTCEESKLCERKTRYIQSLWQRGFVDCITTDGHSKLVGYLSKYMSKSMQDERLHGQKSYVASSNVLRSVSISSRTPLDYSKEIWDIDLSQAQPLLEREFSTQWLGKGRYRLFEI